MARVPALSREDVPEDKRHIYDEIAASRGEVSGPFSALINSPDVAGRVANLGTYIRFESTLPGTVQELAILTASRELNCQYEWTHHETLAHKAGVSDNAIEAVRDRRDLVGLTREDASVIQFVREAIRSHRVSDETFGEARKLFGTQQITDLTATIAYYSMIAICLNTLEVELEPGLTPLLPI